MRGSLSLTRRLLWSSVIALCTITAVGGMLLRQNMQTITYQLMDANLIQFAQSLSLFEHYIEAKNNDVFDPKALPEKDVRAQNDTLPLGDENLLLPETENLTQLLPPTRAQIRKNAAIYEEFNLSYSMVFQVWDKYEQRLIVRSKLAPAVPMLPLVSAEQGFTDVEQDDKQWRIYSLVNRDGTRVIYVAHEPSVMRLIASEVVKRIGWPSLLILIVVLLVWLWIVVRGLKPLHQLSQEISERSTMHLAPLSVENNPVETQPMVRALNHLMARLSDSIMLERQFTGNAAHELRTPLAIIDTLSQTALLKQDLSLLPKIKEATQNARAQIDQLLTLARIDSYAGLDNTYKISPLAVAQKVCADMMNIYGVNRVEFVLEGDTGIQVESNDDLMYILLRNIIENAVIHAIPKAGEQQKMLIGVDTFLDANGSNKIVKLRIQDNGSKFDEVAIVQYTERFYRGKTAQNTQGLGIGLSIVKKICEVQHATLEMGLRKDGQAGMSVQINFRI